MNILACSSHFFRCTVYTDYELIFSYEVVIILVVQYILIID